MLFHKKAQNLSTMLSENLLYFDLKAGICQIQQHKSLIIGLNNHYPFFTFHMNSKLQKHITEHYHLYSGLTLQL